MRICFVSGEYPPMQGGVGDFTHELGRALMELGHKVAVVTSRRAQTQLSRVSGATTPEPAVYPVIRKWNWMSWRNILHVAHAFQSDVLHIQYQTAAYGMHPAINLLPLRLRLKERRPRIVVTFHDLREPYLFPKAGMVRKWVNLLLARWSDAAIVTNIEDYEQLKQTHSAILGEVKDLYLIPIGSNIHPQPPPGYDRAAWRHSLGIADDETLLCYFGFLNKSKGGEVLFRALAELLRRGYKAKLLMIGGQVGDSDPTNVAYLEHVKALGNELGLQEHVLWTGYTPTEQVSANFLAADICVLPYRDGVSYRRGSFMAALAHGLPIVSTKPRVPIATLVDGKNILLVPPDNALATAEAIERLISEPMLRARLAQGAKELAGEFTWDRIAEENVRVYHKLLGAQVDG
ncbi:MAG: glycosyltransferase family 4 protein [Anaerolineae bacterium]